MSRLWINEPATPEGKYPVVLRRDGTQFESGHFLISVHDPGFPEAMTAYAACHEKQGSDPAFVEDCRQIALAAAGGEFEPPPRKPDPDAPPHRQDNAAVLLWHREGWQLDEFVAWTRVAIDFRPRHLRSAPIAEVLNFMARVELAKLGEGTVPVPMSDGRIVGMNNAEYKAWLGLQEENDDELVEPVPTTPEAPGG